MKTTGHRIDLNCELFVDAFFVRKNSHQEEVLSELAKIGFETTDEVAWVTWFFLREPFNNESALEIFHLNKVKTPVTLIEKFNLPEFIPINFFENEMFFKKYKALKSLRYLSFALVSLSAATNALEDSNFDEFMSLVYISVESLGRYVASRNGDMQATVKASLKSIKGHKGTIKQKEKIMVREYWEAWQSNPDQYVSATNFATVMIDKFCPDDPKEQSKHLSSIKKITEWCTLWGRENNT